MAEMTEIQKLQHIKEKYKDVEVLYFIYRREHVPSKGYWFPLAFASIDKERAKKFVEDHEKLNESLIVYVTHPIQRKSKFVYSTKIAPWREVTLKSKKMVGKSK